jgi:hypothetical protein
MTDQDSAASSLDIRIARAAVVILLIGVVLLMGLLQVSSIDDRPLEVAIFSVTVAVVLAGAVSVRPALDSFGQREGRDRGPARGLLYTTALALAGVADIVAVGAVIWHLWTAAGILFVVLLAVVVIVEWARGVHIGLAASS